MQGWLGLRQGEYQGAKNPRLKIEESRREDPHTHTQKEQSTCRSIIIARTGNVRCSHHFGLAGVTLLGSAR